MNMIKYLLLGASVVYIAIIATNIIIGHSSSFYSRYIKATSSGIIASMLGMLFIVLIVTAEKYNYAKKLLIGISIYYLVLSSLAIYFLFAIGFYLGGCATLLWFYTSIIAIFGINIEQIGSPNSSSLKNNIRGSLISHQSNNIENSLFQKNNQKIKRNNKMNKCGYCCHACWSIFTILLISLFVSVSITCFANLVRFPAYGSEIVILSEQDGQEYMVHGYCIGEEQSKKPTIVFQHGGGSNSIAFSQLGFELQKRGWKMCTYDRLGYGRSSVSPHSLKVETRAEITHKAIKKLLQNDHNKQIIIGGWSAGVEIVQTYNELYPTNVKGMIFLDGYPDYITLMAIQDNKTQVIRPNTAAILQILRILEPLGLGFIVGDSKIPNQTARQYYRAYYQTGYLWQSQYMDVSNPYFTTSWLTEKAVGATKPYPNSSINLNWPDIKVPLLVMPANETLSGGQYSQIYQLQAQKYIDKCTCVNKSLYIMKGDHAFVLDRPSEVAEQIGNFFNLIF